MKKVLSVFLCVVLLTNLIPIAASADTQYVEVIKDSAPIRDTYYETGNVLKWVSRGTMLRVIDTTINSKLNTWLRVEYDTGYSCGWGWIYSGNVSTHQHNYERFYYNGNTFCVCRTCNTISIEKITTVEVSKANSVALALPSAAAAAAVDGPIPVGDVAALFILLIACFEMGQDVTTSQVVEMVDTMDLERFTEGSNQCGLDSFYKVARVPTGLKKIDNKCLNIMQAFVCVRFGFCDVWTETQLSAKLCAAINGNYWGPEIDADQPNYFQHFHLGTDHKHKDSDLHIFFGTSPSGQYPQ